MENRIEDVPYYLYLGCEVQVTTGYGLQGPPNVFNGIMRGYILDEWKQQELKPAIQVYISDTTYYYYKTEQVKLKLRKLSDMNEEEAKEYLLLKFNALQPTKLSAQKHENGFWYAFKEQMPFEVGLRKFIFTADIKDSNCPEQTIWLLSKSFDLFGLCDAGLAIDANSIKNGDK